MTSGFGATRLRGLVSTLFFLAATFIACIAAAQDWRIEAGAVTIASGDSPQVTGVFFVHAPPGTAADAAPRTGGACLLADLVSYGIGLASCETVDDCNTAEALDLERYPNFQGGHGYCISRDGSDEPRKCWTRPGPPDRYCLRSMDGLRLTPGVHQLPRVPADPLGRGDPLPDWVVLACIAAEGQAMGCGASNAAHRQTSVTPLP